MAASMGSSEYADELEIRDRLSERLARSSKEYQQMVAAPRRWEPDRFYCEDDTIPGLEHYMRYLGFDPSTDENFVWIFQALKEEIQYPERHWGGMPVSTVTKASWTPGARSPIGFSLVSWVDASGRETYKPPHYDKYRKMLQAARHQKPVAYWTEIMAFRIEFLLSGIFAAERKTAGEYPLFETVENVFAMSQIFGFDLVHEPYLVHVVKHALRHYSQVLREKGKVQGVEVSLTRFRDLATRFRDLVEQKLSEQDDAETAKLLAQVLSHWVRFVNKGAWESLAHESLADVALIYYNIKEGPASATYDEPQEVVNDEPLDWLHQDMIAPTTS